MKTLLTLIVILGTLSVQAYDGMNWSDNRGFSSLSSPYSQYHTISAKYVKKMRGQTININENSQGHQTIRMSLNGFFSTQVLSCGENLECLNSIKKSLYEEYYKNLNNLDVSISHREAVFEIGFELFQACMFQKRMPENRNTLNEFCSLQRDAIITDTLTDYINFN